MNYKNSHFSVTILWLCTWYSIRIKNKGGKCHEVPDSSVFRYTVHCVFECGFVYRGLPHPRRGFFSDTRSHGNPASTAVRLASVSVSCAEKMLRIALWRHYKARSVGSWMTGCCGFILFGKDRFFKNVTTVHLTLSGCETKLEVSFIQKSEIHAVASGVGKFLIGCDHSFATLLKSIFQSRSGMLFQIPVHVRHDFFFH